MTNEEAVDLLEDAQHRLTEAVIDRELLCDARLACTIGVIMGAIVEGLAAYREDRKIRYAEMIKKTEDDQ